MFFASTGSSFRTYFISIIFFVKRHYHILVHNRQIRGKHFRSNFLKYITLHAIIVYNISWQKWIQKGWCKNDSYKTKAKVRKWYSCLESAQNWSLWLSLLTQEFLSPSELKLNATAGAKMTTLQAVKHIFECNNHSLKVYPWQIARSSLVDGLTTTKGRTIFDGPHKNVLRSWTYMPLCK